MIRTVLWDLDGTLLDFKASESAAIKKCFEIFGFGECTDEMVARYSAVNMRHWEMLERGERTRDEILCGRFEEFLTSCGLDGSAAEAFNLEYEERLTDTVRFLPGAKETVEALRGRVRQCVVTNGNRLVQYPKLRRSGLDRLIDGVFVSEEVGAEKPTRAFFDRVFAALGDADPTAYLIVGDSLTSDMRGGVNAGIRTCWYNPRRERNAAGLPLDYEIDALERVIGIIGKES
ncbi:MAG: YjjG family noncanonical pyrimidine nucleotidase [Oscillospiraceae bacterium]|nr:YjjG family noncanonical pyrimidine nucleotidase [Oscillospiraceae bacterium]